MAEEEEVMVFVSFRVEDLQTPVPGSTKATCSQCAAEVWVSPESRPLLEKAQRVLCRRCAPPESDDISKVEPPLPGQLVEVAQGLLPKVAKELREVARRHPWVALRPPLGPPPGRHYKGLGPGLQVGFTFDQLPGFCTEHLSVAWKEREPDMKLMAVIIQAFFGEEKELLAEIHKWPTITVYHFHKIVRSAS